MPKLNMHSTCDRQRMINVWADSSHGSEIGQLSTMVRMALMVPITSQIKLLKILFESRSTIFKRSFFPKWG